MNDDENQKCNICDGRLSFIYGWGLEPDKTFCLKCADKKLLKTSTIPVRVFEKVNNENNTSS
jgi:hypothetical protein